MQGCAKKIKKELEKNDCPSKYFVVNGSTLEGCRRTVTIHIQVIYMNCLHHKGNSTVLSS